MSSIFTAQRILLLAAVLPLIVGCQRARNALPELSQPAKPKPGDIASARERYRENVPVVPAPASIAPVFTPPRWTVQQAAADALARIGPPSVPALTDALSDPDPLVRLEATHALARMGPPAKPAVPKLIVALGDSDRAVRQGAARALGQIGPGAVDAIPALMEVIRDPNADADSAARG